MPTTSNGVEGKKVVVKQETVSGGDKETDAAHAEAVEFVGKNRDLLEHYARGRVKIEPAPPGLDTFSFDLERNTIYVNSRFYKKLGLSDQRTYFATRHEIEHFLEKLALLAESGGDRMFSRYLDRIEKDKAFSLMDNCVADIRENRTVVGNNQEVADLERGMYAEDLFPSEDLSAAPKHIQFCEALLNEGRFPDRQMKVDEEVRQKLDELRSVTGQDGSDLIEAMTRPDTPMSQRLLLQDRYIWPIIEELREKDVEDHKKSGDGKGQGKDGKEAPGQQTDGAESQEGPLDPNEIFKDAYDEAAKKVPNAVPVEEIVRAFKKWQEKHKENPLDVADREYAEKIGVKPDDLRRYRDIVASLEKVKNPETRESVIDELRQLINRIIARRLKPTAASRYPVEEGEELVDPSELVSQFKAGNLEPKVWETYEIKEKTGKKFGEIEITLVCDRSGSMAQEGGAKMIEQRRAAVLMMEALKEFADATDAERINLEKPLEVRSEVYTFQATGADSVPAKKMSKELGEKERIEIAAVLSFAPGQRTTDFTPLEAIESSLTKESIQKIADGELKKIVIVFTDGESDMVQRVKNILEKLRGKGIVAVGVGITESGRAALETYAPDARLAQTAEKLPIVLGELLKEHLADI